MLFKGILATQLSGSLAGITASRNKGGTYFRDRAIPINPNTVAQQVARTVFGAAAIKWASLTSPQRAAWGSYANATPVTNRIGDSIELTGFNWYVAVASFMARTFNVPVDDAPLTPGLSSLGNVTSITLSEADGVSLVTTGATGTLSAFVGVSAVRSPGEQRIDGPYSIYSLPAMAATGFASSPQTQSPGRYGVLLTGEIRAVRIRAIDAQGKLSNVVERLVTVLA